MGRNGNGNGKVVEKLVKKALWDGRTNMVFKFHEQYPSMVCLMEDHQGRTVAVGAAKYNITDREIGLPYRRDVGEKLAKTRAIDSYVRVYSEARDLQACLFVFAQAPWVDIP